MLTFEQLIELQDYIDSLISDNIALRSELATLRPTPDFPLVSATVTVAAAQVVNIGNSRNAVESEIAICLN